MRIIRPIAGAGRPHAKDHQGREDHQQVPATPASRGNCEHLQHHASPD
jgi:hypothetical protein